MARNLISVISGALKGVAINPQIRASLRDSAYEAISWGGLQETKVWYNKSDTGYIQGFNDVLRDTSLRIPLNVPGVPGHFMQDHVTLKAKAYCL
jgi:hypothetical protein